MKDMTWERWQRLPESKRAELRDLSGLTPELIGLEGWRVECTFDNGPPERFIVGRSSGWKPAHIMLKRRDSTGAFLVWPHLTSVRKIAKIR